MDAESDRRRQFGWLMAAETMSLLGDQLLAVALPLFVFDRTGRAAPSVGIVLARVAPLALLGALGGTIVDRANRRTLLVAVSGFRAIAVLPLLLVSMRIVPLASAFGVVAVLAAAAQLTEPAVGASLPAVVTPDDLPRANARLAARSVVVQLAAPTLGAASYATLGLSAVVIGDAALYGLAGITSLLLRLEPPRVGPPNRVLTDMINGVRRVLADPLLRALVTTVTLALIGLGIELAVLVPYIRSVLHGSASSVGALTSSEAVGGLLGASLTPLLARRLGTIRMVGVGICGLPVAAIGFVISRNVAQAVVGVLLAGLLLTVLTTGFRTYMQSTVEHAYLGRVLGVIGSTVGLAAVLGAIVALPLTHTLSLRSCLLAAALIESLAVVGYFSVRR